MTVGQGSVLLAYIIQSFQKFFVLLFVRIPPFLMRKATCKYILRALLTTIAKVCTSKQFPFYRPKLKSLQPSKSCL